MRANLIAAVSVAMIVGVSPGCTAQGPERAEIAYGPRPAGEPALFANEDLKVGFPRSPSVSPDGSLIVFSWASDLWAVNADGGTATRLTSHPALDLRSAFSPDGSLLAFDSNRDGGRDLCIMPLMRTDGAVLPGPIRRVTSSDRAATFAGFSADGSELLFSGRFEPEIYRQSSMYAVPVDGGPVRRVTDAFGSAPNMSPDGSTIVFTRGRNSWDRPAYRGSGARSLWTLAAEDHSFTRLTTSDANDGDGYVAADGSIVFVSSRDGQNNVWRLARGRTEGGRNALTQLTTFAPAPGELTIGHGVRDFSVCPAGRTATFVVWDTIYTLDLTTSAPEARPVTVLAAPDTHHLDTQVLSLNTRVTEAALSPDGNSIAVVARGEIFVRSTAEGRPTRRVTDSVWRKQDIAWSPDGRYLYFVSDEGGRDGIYRASVALAREDIRPREEKPEEPADEPADEPDADEPDNGNGAAQPARNRAATNDRKKVDHGKRWAESLRFDIEPVVDSAYNDHGPVPSPDGRKLLFIRSRGDLHELDLATGEQRLILESWNQPSVSWASDSRHIIYSVSDLDFNSDIWIMDTGAQPPEAVNISRHPDADIQPRLSRDGKVLLFLSDRGEDTRQYDVWRVYLDKELEGLTDYELEEYHKEQAAAARKLSPPDTFDPEAPPETAEPLAFDRDALSDAYLRAQRLTNFPGRASNLQITPAADRIIFSATIDGRGGLYSMDFKRGDRRLLQAGGVGNVSITLKGDKVVFVRSGEANATTPTAGRTDTYSISARVTIDVAQQQRQKFLEASRVLGEWFYHPTMKGLDWDGLTERYLQLAMQTRTSSDFNSVGNMLFGELDGSHLGMSGGDSFSGPSSRTGYLGAHVEPAPNGFRVLRAVRGTPAYHPNTRLHQGDVITHINGVALAEDGRGPQVDLAEAMAGTSGEETLLEVDRADPSNSRYVLLTPISFGAWNNAAYEDETLRRTQIVDELSGGRLGYLHIRGMNMPAVRDFVRDLYAVAHGKDGLIIDVRDNGGGSTNDILLTSLTAPNHAYTVPRGADPETVPHDAYPRDRRFIYAYTRPITVLCNENSFSNAEIFSHAIKTIGRGTLVGVPTFGGVISTGSATLIDGTRVRRPFRGWYLPDGTDMENNGAVPDIIVEQTPESEVEGHDVQLEAAVRELLGRVGN